ncbi:Hypothetical_protein [Hexamita inflata]|uniref:Hypothetical_protein n=1 Tax=Hexamita inflata TaxID=28002 RepID=A0AA86R502_9EUKA|nr:Hypothetical protein HINF_LOCUS58310 [Hexamita inflata]
MNQFTRSFIKYQVKPILQEHKLLVKQTILTSRELGGLENTLIKIWDFCFQVRMKSSYTAIQVIQCEITRWELSFFTCEQRRRMRRSRRWIDFSSKTDFQFHFQNQKGQLATIIINFILHDEHTKMKTSAQSGISACFIQLLKKHQRFKHCSLAISPLISLNLNPCQFTRHSNSWVKCINRGQLTKMTNMTCFKRKANQNIQKELVQTCDIIKE